MRKFLADLTVALGRYCPTFVNLPLEVPYPHITLEEIHSLSGLPGGPTLINFKLKIWSRYAGVREILTILKHIESSFRTYPTARFKIMKSFLSLFPDDLKRVHTLHVKARIPYERD